MKIARLTDMQMESAAALAIAVCAVTAVLVQYGFGVPAIPFLGICLAGSGLFLYSLGSPAVYLYLLPVFIPFVGFSLFNIGTTFGFDGTYLLMSMLIMASFIRLIFRGSIIGVISGRVLLASGALFLGAALSGMAVFTYEHFDLNQYVKSLLHGLFYVLVFLSIATLNVNDQVMRRFLAATIAVGIVVCLYGIYQLVARLYGLPMAILPLTSAKQGVHIESVIESYGRISSFFSEPSWLGHYLVRGSVVAVVLLTGSLYSRFLRNTLFAVLILFLITLFLSFSAGAITVAALLFAFMLVREKDHRRKLFFSLAAVLLLFFAVNALLISVMDIDLLNMIGLRFSGLFTGEHVQSESAGQRLIETETALGLWSENPFWGIGAGMAKIATGELFWITNFYALLLAEQGVSGLVCFLLFTLVLFAGMYRALQKTRRGTETRVYALMLFYVLVADYLSLVFAGDILTAKCYLDFGLVYAFSEYVENGQSPAGEDGE